MAYDRCCPRNVLIGILFSKGNIPVAKANAYASPAQIFPSASVKLGDEAIKSDGFPQVGKPEKITRIKFINYK
ncbi:hypothetical protein CS562_28475 [Paenibacillus sp. LK1]|nr:hypothetical protein CS562_28475 [Paenibacillus sp. LK1]